MVSVPGASGPVSFTAFKNLLEQLDSDNFVTEYLERKLEDTLPFCLERFSKHRNNLPMLLRIILHDLSYG